MPSEKQRERQQENYGSKLLMDLVEGRKPDPQHVQWLKKDFRHDFGWANSGGSWNHWQILTAARLWLSADPIAIALILDYLRVQLGERKSPKHPVLEYFGGTEQGSNTYEGWRWGFVLAARLLALRFPDHPAAKEMLELTARYNQVQTALLALGAAPGPTKTGDVLSLPVNGGRLKKGERFVDGMVVSPAAVHTNARDQLWWEGPSLPMSGNRSTPAHIGTDERMPIYEWYRGLDNPPYKRERFGWPEKILRLVTNGFRDMPDAGFDEETVREEFVLALAGIRLLTPHHFATWREEGVRANWIERQSNGNTSSILGHVTFEKESRAVYLWPWPGQIRGKKNEGPGEAECWVPATRDGGWSVGVRMIARSRFGEVSCELPPREPDSHVVMGPQGLEVVR